MSLIQRRLEACELFIVTTSMEEWSLICSVVLPEAFAEPEGEPEPAGVYSGTPTKVAVLAERFEKGQQLHRPDDASVPDAEGILWLHSPGNHKLKARKVTEDGVTEQVEPEVVKLQGEGRAELPGKTSRANDAETYQRKVHRRPRGT